MSAATGAYARDVAWTTPLGDDTGMTVRIVAEDSHVLRYRWLKQNRYFSTFIESGHIKDMTEGLSTWATRLGGPFQVRAYWSSGGISHGAYFVRGDSDIKTMQDIKPGVRVAYLTFAPAGRTVIEAALEWAGVDYADAVWVPANTVPAAVNAVMDGKADLTWLKPLSPIMYEAEASPHGVRWLSCNPSENPEGVQRFLKVFFVTTFEPMPAGPPSAIGAWGFGSMNFYGTSADSDPELVYNVTKWLDQNFYLYKDKQYRAGQMTIDNFMTAIDSTFAPVHEGSVRYLKEIGRWTEGNEARQQENLQLVTSYVEAYDSAIATADSRGIEIDPRNEAWMKLWEDTKERLGLPLCNDVLTSRM
jgi:hypothetical protein